MKIEVDREACISVASCVQVAPGTFELDDKGIAIVKKSSPDTLETVLQAAKSCPVNAIRVYDDSGALLWPKK